MSEYCENCKEMQERLDAKNAAHRNTCGATGSVSGDGQYIKALESFMGAVAREVGCLPSFADPTPDGDNAHIIRKIRELKQND